MNARAWLAACVLWPALAQAQAAAHVVRTLFVGIDTYEYAGADNGFGDLHGAVADAIMVKTALRKTYPDWGIDRDGAPPACPVAAPIAATRSITLVNACATRAAILGMLNGLIAVSAPGDTVIFYYAGHGARIDDVAFDTKASGYNDTLLTYDARGPADSDYHTEIVDRELNVIIENARNVQGANVITLFDSCHSGSADRDGAHTPRSAPTVTVAALAQPVGTLLPVSAPAIGHRAHLGASADDELANEAPMPPDGVHGVFSRALADAIRAHPGAPLSDLLNAARAEIVHMGYGQSQHPTGDGLLLTLDGTSTAGQFLSARASPAGAVTLDDGRLGAVTLGSRYALYADWNDARLARGMLALGTVSALADQSATLALDARPPAALPADLVARETDHAFGDTRVSLALALHRRDAMMAAQKTIAGFPFARIANPPEMVIADAPDGRGVVLRAADGTLLGPLPAPADPRFADALKAAIAARARLDELVTLQNRRGGAELLFCASNTFFDRTAGFICPDPPPRTHGPQALALGRTAYLAIVNLASAPRYVTLFALGDDNAVTLLTQQDAPLPPGRPQAIDLVPGQAGTTRFLVLATEAPIDAAALEQSGGTRDPQQCTTLIARLLCEANAGTRDPALPHAGDWAGLIATVRIVAARPTGK